MDINRLARGLEAFSNWSQVSLPADCDGGRKKRGCENCSAPGRGDKKCFIFTDFEDACENLLKTLPLVRDGCRQEVVRIND